MKPATSLLVFCVMLFAVWLLGIYAGAAWERQSMGLTRAGLLCLCDERTL
jgi:hypothetical protein